MTRDKTSPDSSEIVSPDAALPFPRFDGRGRSVVPQARPPARRGKLTLWYYDPGLPGAAVSEGAFNLGLLAQIEEGPEAAKERKDRP